MASIDCIHLGCDTSGSGEASRLLRPRTMSSAPIVVLMTRPTVETMFSAPPKRTRPEIPITTQVVKYPSARAAALRRGLRDPRNSMVRSSNGGATEPPIAKTIRPGSRSPMNILAAIVPVTPIPLFRPCAQQRGERAAIALGSLCQDWFFLLVRGYHHCEVFLSPYAAISSRWCSFCAGAATLQTAPAQLRLLPFLREGLA